MPGKPQMRCQVCRLWINVAAAATRLPPHNNILKEACRGANNRPAQTRGMG